jgi:hypothetical protein
VTATFMTAAQRADFESDNAALLQVCLRDGITNNDWMTIAVAASPGADTGQRLDAVLLVAGPLMDVLEPGDGELLLRAFLPRLSVADRRQVLADVRCELEQVTRWEDAAAGCDAPDDDLADPDERAAAFRSSARHLATTAALR